MIDTVLAMTGAAPVDENLSHLSDLAFRTGWAVYVLALVCSMVNYAQFKVPTAPRSPERHTGSAGATSTDGTTATPSTATPSDDTVVERSTSLTDTAAEDAAAEHGNTRWGRMGLLFTVLGFAFHVGALVLRGLATSRVPWGNLYEFVTLTCALAMAAALVFLRKPALRVAWPFVLVPVVVLLFVAGTKLYSVAAPVVPALRSFWLPIHVSIVSTGSGLFLVAGVASLLYLLRTWMPRGAERGPLAALVRPLPSGETLDRLAYRTTIIGFAIFGIGVLFGAIWAETAWGRFWGWDPKETTSFITWVVYAGYLHARATSGWGARRAAWVNLVGFAAMLFNLFLINLVVSGLHSYAGLN